MEKKNAASILARLFSSSPHCVFWVPISGGFCYTRATGLENFSSCKPKFLNPGCTLESHKDPLKKKKNPPAAFLWCGFSVLFSKDRERAKRITTLAGRPLRRLPSLQVIRFLSVLPSQVPLSTLPAFTWSGVCSSPHPLFGSYRLHAALVNRYCHLLGVLCFASQVSLGMLHGQKSQLYPKATSPDGNFETGPFAHNSYLPTLCKAPF